MERPFRILGVQQIALGAKSKDALAFLWTELFGIPKVSSFQSERENVDEDILRIGHGAHAVEVDLMQPLDETKKPRVDEPALNHIGLWVDDLAAAVTWLTTAGVRFAPGGIRKGAAGHDVTFIHPKANEQFPHAGNGILIELVQAPADVIAELTKG
jgi:lactoylglutathione lyase